MALARFGLLAMPLGLYAFVAALLSTLINWTIHAIVADVGADLPLWQHTVVNIASCMVMTASYRRSVEFFKDAVGIEEMVAMVGAFSVSLLFAAACSFPFEYMMAQIQKTQPNSEGKHPCTCSCHCAAKTFIAGGLFKFYIRFLTYCVRISLHLMVTWMFNHLLKSENCNC